MQGCALYYSLTLELFQSLRVVECPNFHKLTLLLCQDITETDVPKCTKLHDKVLSTWVMWFMGLRQDLQVSALPAVGLLQQLTHTVQAACHVSLTVDAWTNKPQ